MELLLQKVHITNTLSSRFSPTPLLLFLSHLFKVVVEMLAHFDVSVSLATGFADLHARPVLFSILLSSLATITVAVTTLLVDTLFVYHGQHVSTQTFLVVSIATV